MGKRQTDFGAVAFAGNLNKFAPSLSTMPCACEDRTFCGDLNIRIKADGTWHYNGSPINRPEMVHWFASMLKLDEEGRHWLITPTEIGRIDVDDAPFVVVDFHVSGEHENQVLCFCTNLDDVVCIDAKTPVTMEPNPLSGELTPYVQIGDGLKAKITRAVYYELVELGTSQTINGQTVFGLWSAGHFFPLGSLSDKDA